MNEKCICNFEGYPFKDENAHERIEALEDVVANSLDFGGDSDE